MAKTAFALREAYFDDDGETSFQGSVALVDGTTFDVAEALEKGEGTIVTQDDQLVVTLDNYPALKRTSLPEPKKKAADAGKTDKKDGDK